AAPWRPRADPASGEDRIGGARAPRCPAMASDQVAAAPAGAPADARTGPRSRDRAGDGADAADGRPGSGPRGSDRPTSCQHTDEGAPGRAERAADERSGAGEGTVGGGTSQALPERTIGPEIGSASCRE